jgi:hypothetical protein
MKIADDMKPDQSHHVGKRPLSFNGLSDNLHQEKRDK